MSEALLSYQEVEELLESILVNQKLASVESRDGTKFVVFSYPATKEIIQSRYIKKKAYLEAVEQGLPTKADVEIFVQKAKVLSNEDEKEIQALDDKITAQRRLLQITKIEGRRKPILDIIAASQTRIDEIRSKSKSFLYLSAETKSEEEALLYLTWLATYSLAGLRYWETFQAFEDELDLLFRSHTIEAFSEFNQGLPTKTIRFLARHGLWRIRYASALRVGGTLFCRDLYDLTPDQLSLIYWSDYYQSIYEMMPDDRPEDSIIQDDAALDSYMEDLAKRREQERNEGRVKRRGGETKGKLSPWEKGEELIITAAHPEYMNMVYSEKRIKAAEGTSDVDVMVAHRERAKVRRAAGKDTSFLGGGKG